MHTGVQPGRPLAHRPPLNVWGVLDRARTWGFDGVMLSVDQIPRPDPELLAEVRARADALDLYLELELRFAQLPGLATWVRAARTLGTSSLRIVVGPFGNGERWTFDRDARAYLADVARMLAPAGNAARDHGVTLAIENHMDFTLEEYEYLFGFLDPEAFGVCLDTGNSWGTVELPDRVCRTLAPLAVTTHVKDYLPVRTADGYRLLTRPLGDGIIDWPGIVDAVRVFRPDVHVNLELPVFSVREIPVLRPGFWESYGGRPAGECAQVLACVENAADRRPAEIRNGVELGWPEEQLLREEERVFRASLQRVRAWDSGRRTVHGKGVPCER